MRSVVPQAIDCKTSQEAAVPLSFRVARALRSPRFVVEGIDGDGRVRELRRAKALVAVPAEMVQVDVRGIDVSGYSAVRVRVEGKVSQPEQGRASEPGLMPEHAGGGAE